MSRGLALFVAFCVGLAVLAGVAVAWLGPAFVAFALDGERRAAPVTVLTLVRLADGAGLSVDGADFLDQTAIAAHEGSVWWRGTATMVVDGTVADEWDVVSLASLPNGAALIEIVTSPEHRDRDAQVARWRAASVTYVVEDDLEDFDASNLAVFLVDLPEADSAGEAVALLGAAVERFGGVQRWRTRLTRLFGPAEPSWDLLVAIDFPDAAALRGWLDDPERVTAASVADTRLDAHRLILVERG